MFYFDLMKMRLKTWQNILQSFFVILFCVAIPIFFSYAFASGTETRYTDFEITSPESVSTSSGQTTGSYTWSLTNYDTDVVNWEFYFVDAVPLWSGYYACKADNQSGVFGQYLHMDWDTVFSVQPWDTITWTIKFDFPASYSGTYDGCIVYSVRDDLNVWGDAVVNMSSRKAKKVSVTLQASEVGIRIVANLWSRGNASTLNLNWYESKWKILFYPPNHNPNDLPIESWYIIMNHNGFGELEWVTVLAGTYDVVYKWWHHLASYIQNVTINEWDTLDFVRYAIWVWEEEHIEQLKYNSWWTFQIAWDLPTANNNYDNVINGTDLSVLLSDRCHYREDVATGFICDLNGDHRVDSSDASVIFANLDVVDSLYHSNFGLFTWFGYVDYFEHPYYNQ